MEEKLRIVIDCEGENHVLHMGALSLAANRVIWPMQWIRWDRWSKLRRPTLEHPSVIVPDWCFRAQSAVNLGHGAVTTSKKVRRVGLILLTSYCSFLTLN